MAVGHALMNHDSSAAERYFSNAIEQFRTCLDADGERTSCTTAIAGCQCNLGMVYASAGKMTESREMLDTAVTTLSAVGADNALATEYLGISLMCRAELSLHQGLPANALTDLAGLGDRTQDAATQFHIGVLKAAAFAQTEQWSLLPELCAGLLESKTKRISEVSVYELACVLSLTSHALNESSYAKEAVRLLRQLAKRDVFQDAEYLVAFEFDRDLNPLREREDFIELRRNLHDANPVISRFWADN